MKNPYGKPDAKAIGSLLTMNSHPMHCDKAYAAQSEFGGNPINGVGGYATTRALYDTIGRQYTVGLRFRF